MLTQFSLLSIEFLGVSFGAVMSMALLTGNARKWAFLAANLVFIWGFLLGPLGAICTVAFCLLGYLLVLITTRIPRLGFIFSLLSYVILFIYMRNYTFLDWLLPESAMRYTLSTIGLSFLFFKVLHVTIEARSGTLGTLRFLTFMNFCLNFTTFMMGPIQRYQDFTAQWSGVKQALEPKLELYLDAVLRILLGFIKAYVLAEWLAPLALTDPGQLLSLSLTDLLVRIYTFYFFLYFNFSGYCDIVIGIGSLLGVKPPENFDKPFLAKNISDFWLRFHRSLTEWLTDYVFSPIYKWALMNKRLSSIPLVAMSTALILTMLISGLWHGTTLSFLIFGLIHGIYFIIFRSWDSLATKHFGKERLKRWHRKWSVQLLCMIITFNAVSFSLLFFRLDAPDAFEIFKKLARL